MTRCARRHCTSSLSAKNEAGLAHELSRQKVLHHRGPFRVERIEDAVTGLRCLSADEQESLALRVVDRSVADAAASGEGGHITSAHRVETAVDPHVDLALEHVDELLLVLLGVGPRRTMPRRHAEQVQT
jgi:hypothetical protein